MTTRCIQPPTRISNPAGHSLITPQTLDFRHYKSRLDLFGFGDLRHAKLTLQGEKACSLIWWARQTSSIAFLPPSTSICMRIFCSIEYLIPFILWILFIAPDWLFKWFSYCNHDSLISITPHWVILYAMVIFMRLNWSRKVSKWSIFGVSSNTLCMQPSKRDKLITFVKDDLELTVDSLSGDPLTKVFRSKLNCKSLMCTHPNEYFVTLIIFEELFCR